MMLSVVAPVIALAAPPATRSGLSDGVYYNAELAVRYTPPQGMTDETADAQDAVRARAAAAHTTNTFDVMLSLVSGLTMPWPIGFLWPSRRTRAQSLPA